MEDMKPIGLSEAHVVLRRAKSIVNLAEALTQVERDNQEPILWALASACFGLGNIVDDFIPCEHKDE